MSIIYKTNGAPTTKSLTEWFFGKRFVATATEQARKAHETTGAIRFKTWQEGTGYLTIEIN